MRLQRRTVSSFRFTRTIKVQKGFLGTCRVSHTHALQDYSMWSLQCAEEGMGRIAIWLYLENIGRFRHIPKLSTRVRFREVFNFITRNTSTHSPANNACPDQLNPMHVTHPTNIVFLPRFSTRVRFRELVKITTRNNSTHSPTNIACPDQLNSSQVAHPTTTTFLT